MNKSPRFMIAAPSSGSGKTMLTCGLMRLLQKKGYEVQGFTCWQQEGAEAGKR